MDNYGLSRSFTNELQQAQQTLAGIGLLMQQVSIPPPNLRVRDLQGVLRTATDRSEGSVRSPVWK